jgi:hypothetical protein
MFEGHEYRLEVPLDASQIPDFKPDRPVKVIACGSRGETHEQTVTLDSGGKGATHFGFKEKPGVLKVALGPENASAEDLKHLQTIAVTVPASSWRDSRELRLSPVAISPYYWWWWWEWCQTFTITGRVLCADGNPVVGAAVCAYDVDWWWWWVSQQQVGCATTDTSGSFQITFTRCCGWWPWWWWELREWQLDPVLVDKIGAVVRQNPTLSRLPKASPKPSLEVFQQVLAAAGTGSRGKRTGKSAARLPQLAAGSAINPAELDSLRAPLLEVLPKEFPYPIWPWYPWFPWWDCDADIIFQVTQNCGGQTNTIISETIADTRWDIPNNLTVTLTANDQACCAYSCQDPEQCPEGNCLVPSDICDINVSQVGGNVGNPTCPPLPAPPCPQVGLFDPTVQDRPFAGNVDLFGIFGSGAAVDYYEFEYSTTGQAGPYSPLPMAAVGGFSRKHLVVLPGPVFTWPWIPFPATPISDGVTSHTVIETIAHYEANNGVQVWDSITHDLLLMFTTQNTLPNGTYWLRLVSWQRPGYTGNLTNRTVLPLCDPNPNDPPVDNWWVVTIDNQAPGNTDPSGQPCGLHICTDQPTSAILQVAIVHSGGGSTIVQGCGNICINDTDLLQIDFAAYDPDGFLSAYGLELLYGVDQSVNLLCSDLCPSITCNPCFTTWSLAPSPIAPGWAPAAAQVGPDYATALTQGASSPVWGGGSMRLTVNAAAAFPQTCAYLLQLNVYKRPIQNCDAINDEQNNVSFESFTIQVNCVSTPS